MNKEQWHRACCLTGQMLDACGASDFLDSCIPLHLQDVTIRSPKVSADLNDLRILHLTDFHINGSNMLVERIIERVKGLTVDLVVMTGDYHKGAKKKCDCAALARKIGHILSHVNSKNGFFSTMGNHDPDLLERYFTDEGICVLRDKVIDIEIDQPQEETSAENVQTFELNLLGKQTASLRIAGIDYETCKKEVNEIDIDHADPENYSLVLAHTPRAARAMAYRGYDLYLTGHTHGGQVRGFIDIHKNKAEQKRAYGLWREAQMIGYTSRGIGTSNYPLRINSPAEVTLFTLKAA